MSGSGTRAALVTGSARGIGRALVLELARLGYDVAVHYRGSRDAAEEVAAEARERGVEAVTLRADVTVRHEAEALVDAAAAALGGLRVLVNNVGNYHYGPLDELDPDTWLAMFDSNLHAAFYTCRRAVPLLRAGGGGRIVNLGYAGSEQLTARPGIAPYAIAKTGVILYSKALARVHARDAITVNVISPGVMENSVTQPVREIPAGRPGRLEEVAAALRYLVSDEADYVTGVTLEVAGGWNV